MSLTKRPVAGFECKLFLVDIDPEDYDPEELPDPELCSEIMCAKDVDIPDDPEELETSARYSKQKKYFPGMLESAIDFEYQYIRGGEGADPIADALELAKATSEPICVIASDGPLDVPGVVWEINWFYVFKGGRKEALGGTRTKSYSLKPGVVFHSGAILDRGMGIVAEA